MPKSSSKRPARVRGSSSGRPIMVLLDLLGRRWSLRILWELRAGPLSFRALRDRCDAVSPSVLNARLGDLREAGLVTNDAEGYALTIQARALGKLLLPLDAWARRWASAPTGSNRHEPPGTPSPRRAGGQQRGKA